MSAIRLTEAAQDVLVQWAQAGQGLHVEAVEGGCLGTTLRFEARAGEALSLAPVAEEVLVDATLDFRGRRFRAQPAPTDFTWCVCGRSKGIFAQLDLTRCVAKETP